MWVLLEARRGFGSPQRAKNIAPDAKLPSGAAEAPKIYDLSFSFRCLEMPADTGRLGPGNLSGVGEM